VDCAQIHSFKERNEVRLACFLRCKDCFSFHSDVLAWVPLPVLVLSDFAEQPRKRQLADQQVFGSLVVPYLAQRLGARPTPVCARKLFPRRSFHSPRDKNLHRRNRRTSLCCCCTTATATAAERSWSEPDHRSSDHFFFKVVKKKAKDFFLFSKMF